jgi:hypothetical protein
VLELIYSYRNAQGESQILRPHLTDDSLSTMHMLSQMYCGGIWDLTQSLN